MQKIDFIPVQEYSTSMDRDISYSKIRDQLKSEFDRVCRDHEVVRITRRHGENLVVMSEDDYRSLNETMHLMSSSKNHDRLLSAMHSTKGRSYASFKDFEDAFDPDA